MSANNIYVPFVYKWTELSTNKWYIGSRTAKLCHPDDGYVCSSRIVKPLIKSHPSNWRREILYIGTSKEEVLIKEFELLHELDAKHDPMSYNQTNGDSKFIFKGHTEEFKKRKSIERKEYIKKYGHNHTGVKRSKTVCENISKSQKGKVITEEHKQKISNTNKGKPKPPGFGEKISKARMNMEFSEEHKEKLRNAKLGKKRSYQTTDAQREAARQLMKAKWEKKRNEK